MLNEKPRGFLTTAMIGGLVGALAGLLLAPKAGKDLRNDLNNLYGDLSKRGRKKSFGLGRYAGACGDKAKDIGDYILKELDGLTGKKDFESSGRSAHRFVAGAVFGGTLGALSALLFAPKAGSEFREDLSDTCQDLGEKTKQFAFDLANKCKNLTNNDTVEHALGRAKSIWDEGAEILNEAKSTARKGRTPRR